MSDWLALSGDAGSTGLPREEWDFSSCPKGFEADCWAYESARELDWAVKGYAAAQRRAERGLPGEHGFDKDGVWHVLAKGPRCEIELRLPPGFPRVPYLKTERYKPVIPRRRHIYEIWNPPFGERTELGRIFGRHVAKLELKWRLVTVNWDFSDKRIMAEFKAWLRRARTKPARLGSGRSKAREQMKYLRALGAFRLLKRMTAPQALAWTEPGLYAKVPDWYEARKMVLSQLEWLECDQICVRKFSGGSAARRVEDLPQ